MCVYIGVFMYVYMYIYDYIYIYFLVPFALFSSVEAFKDFSSSISLESAEIWSSRACCSCILYRFRWVQVIFVSTKRNLSPKMTAARTQRYIFPKQLNLIYKKAHIR